MPACKWCYITYLTKVEGPLSLGCFLAINFFSMLAASSPVDINVCLIALYCFYISYNYTALHLTLQESSTDQGWWSRPKSEGARPAAS